MTAEPTLAFGELLRRYRAAAGLTQEELATRSGLTPQGISLLERGERRHPQAHTVHMLADALAITVQERAAFDRAMAQGWRVRAACRGRGGWQGVRRAAIARGGAGARRRPRRPWSTPARAG